MSITTSAFDICTGSLKLIGVLADGETATNDQMTDAYARLQEIVDGLGVQRFTMLTRTRTVYPLVANQATYTIGPSGADFTAARPVTVEGCGLVLNSSSPPLELSLTPLTDDLYQAIGIKAQTSTLPTEFYYNPTMPNGSIFLWPTPTVNTNTLAVYVPLAVTQFVSLAASVTLAPMYAKALRYRLGMELAIEFSRPMTEMLARVFAIADESWAQIKAVNTHLSDLSIDPALASQNASQYAYNILSDQNA